MGLVADVVGFGFRASLVVMDGRVGYDKWTLGVSQPKLDEGSRLPTNRVSYLSRRRYFGRDCNSRMHLPWLLRDL